MHGKGKIILLSGVFLVMTGFGMTLPVLPFYIEKLLTTGSSSSGKVSLHVVLNVMMNSKFDQSQHGNLQIEKQDELPNSINSFHNYVIDGTAFEPIFRVENSYFDPNSHNFAKVK